MSAPLQPGVRVRDTYEIVRLLGAKELSSVYLTRASNGEPYVLRDVHPDVDARHMERVIAQVRREAQMLARLRFPGLPVIIDAFGWQGRAFVVRPYSEEPTLVDTLEASRAPVSEQQARSWMAMLLEMFEHLHGEQPPHIYGGLRPTSITVSKMGRLHIRDYPTAYLLPGEMQWKHARRVAPGFMAPEQERGEPLTPTCDVYTLGQLLGFMLTRKDPSLYTYDRSLLAIARPDLSASLLALIEDATRTSPAERLATVADLRARLASTLPPARPEVELGFHLDPHEIRIENARHGEILRRRISLLTGGTREVSGRAHSDRDWIRFKFDTFRGSSVTLEISISTYELEPGESYYGVIQLETDAGTEEIDVYVSMAATLGSRFSKGLKSLFRNESPVDSDKSDF